MKKIFYNGNKLDYADENTETNGFDDLQIFHAFADSLRELRAYCGLSLIKLSSATDIPNQTLSSYERKSRTPSVVQAIKIATYFGLTVEDFIICGLGNINQDITEVYEERKNS